MLTLAALLTQLRTARLVGDDADPGVRARRILGAVDPDAVAAVRIPAPADRTPADAAPADPLPADGIPVDAAPADRAAQETPAQETPGDRAGAEETPAAGDLAAGGTSAGPPLLTERLVVGPLDAPLWQDVARARRTVRAFMHGEATAVLLVALPGADAEAAARARRTAAEAAGRVGLPLLVMEDDDRTCAEVRQAVTDAVAAAYAGVEVRLLKALADLLRSPGPAATGELEKVLDQAARAVDGQAAVIAPDGTVTQSGGYAPRLSRSILAAPVPQVRDGGPAVSADGESGCFVQLLGIDVPAPRPVLAVARTRPYSPRATDLIRRTADTLSLKERIVRAERLDRERAETVPAALLALYTHLMSGDVDNCRKLAATYTPGLLATGQVQVSLLEGPAARRAEVVEAVAATAGAAALVVPHPGSATRVAVVTPAGPGEATPRLRRALEAAVAPFGCSIGQSGAVSCRHTRDAHQMASHALAVARRLPHRTTTHHGEKPLALLLGPEAAPWARWVLRRLDALPDRETLLSTVQHALQHGNSGAARLIGVNRKTVALRCRRAETALGYDLADLRARAVLDLALQIALRPPLATAPGPAAPHLTAPGSGAPVLAPPVPQGVSQVTSPGTSPAPVPPPLAMASPAPPPVLPAASTPQASSPPAGFPAAAAPPLADLLRAPAARAWALDLLAPLRRDSRPLLETVQAWIVCNGRVESCAERLTVHANTVRNHLAACEAALGRRLVGTSGGAYDVVHAVEILQPTGGAPW